MGRHGGGRRDLAGSTSSVNDYSLEPFCSVAGSSTNLTSSTLPRVPERTSQPTNEVLYMEATAPVSRTAHPSRPSDLPVIVGDLPKHFPGSLPLGDSIEPEEYMEMAKCNISLHTASDVATPMAPAIHRQQQKTPGAAHGEHSRGRMRISRSMDRLTTGLQLGAADGGLCPAIACHSRGTDENGYTHMSCKVNVCTPQINSLLRISVTELSLSRDHQGSSRKKK